MPVDRVTSWGNGGKRKLGGEIGGKKKREEKIKSMFLLTTKNAFLPVKRLYNMNTYLQISTVLQESQ